jgi:hypothetical protein
MELITTLPNEVRYSPASDLLLYSCSPDSHSGILFQRNLISFITSSLSLSLYSTCIEQAVLIRNKVLHHILRDVRITDCAAVSQTCITLRNFIRDNKPLFKDVYRRKLVCYLSQAKGLFIN